MEFLSIIFKRSKFFYAALVLLSIVNGLLNIGLLMIINNAIAGQPFFFYPEYTWLTFTVLILFSLVTTKIFQSYMTRLTVQMNFEFEMAILRKLRNARYQDFERLGNEKVYTAMEDIRALGNLPEVFMNAVRAIIIIICCFIYLFTISVTGGAAILGLMVLLLIFYLVRNAMIEKELNLLRNLQNHYFRYLQDLLYGFKELKMSITRNSSMHEQFLEKNREQGKKLRLSTSLKYMNNELTGSYSWYVVIGVILFALPRLFQIEIGGISAFLVTILYLMGPIAVLITLAPIYTNVKIALERLGRFNSLLGNQFSALELQAYTNNLDEPFESIRFEQVCYEYFDERQQKTFMFGPLDLEITKGETLFVVGGNGSGKSTFVSLLTGLYRPQSGMIFFNDVPVSEDNYPYYSNKMSAIFTHAYLFNENYDGHRLDAGNKTLAGLIETFKLTDVVRYNKEKNTIDKNLSKGQQKRLAMVYALLENTSIVVLDEWAAEQDPGFRAFFYQHLLPELKSQGKTIVAITHDDDYLSAADRVVKFDFGKVAYDKKVDVVLSQTLFN